MVMWLVKNFCIKINILLVNPDVAAEWTGACVKFK